MRRIERNFSVDISDLIYLVNQYVKYSNMCERESWLKLILIANKALEILDEEKKLNES